MNSPNEVVEYEGKAKKILTTDDYERVVQSFKDDATAFNGEKKESFPGKGRLNNAFSCHFFELLRQQGIDTHFIGRLNETDMLVKRLKIVPIEFVVRNFVSGSLRKRVGLPEGAELRFPIVETYYKSDAFGDPMLADSHIELLQLATKSELNTIRDAALAVNQFIRTYLAQKGLQLVDIKMEFGYDDHGKLLLGDEISPDICRIWDSNTSQKYDKDVFRQEIGDLLSTYQALADRLCVDL